MYIPTLQEYAGSMTIAKWLSDDMEAFKEAFREHIKYHEERGA